MQSAMRLKAFLVLRNPADATSLESDMAHKAEQLTSCPARRLILVHCMGTDPKQLPPDAPGCGQQTRLCSICKQHLGPNLHVDRPNLIEALYPGQGPRQDRPHMGY